MHADTPPHSPAPPTAVFAGPTLKVGNVRVHTCATDPWNAIGQKVAVNNSIWDKKWKGTSQMLVKGYTTAWRSSQGGEEQPSYFLECVKVEYSGELYAFPPSPWLPPAPLCPTCAAAQRAPQASERARFERRSAASSSALSLAWATWQSGCATNGRGPRCLRRPSRSTPSGTIPPPCSMILSHVVGMRETSSTMRFGSGLMVQSLGSFDLGQFALDHLFLREQSLLRAFRLLIDALLLLVLAIGLALAL